LHKTEKYLQAFKLFEKENNFAPADLDEVVEWAVKRNLLVVPTIDPYKLLADEMGQALRTETAVSKGKRYRINHAVRNGQQILWGMMGYTKPSHMVMSFTQRREGIISDCSRLKNDVDAYNDFNPDQIPYQLILDFTDDVA